ELVSSLRSIVFSNAVTSTEVSYWRTAELWIKLMQDVLGYQKFAAQGGDWGALVTSQLGHKYAQHLIGVHVNLAVPLEFFAGRTITESDYGPDEKQFYQRTQEARPTITSHLAVQTADPQTLAYGMHDSPVSLAA